MKILLHICCAPCSIEVVDSLRSAGHDLTGFWYNPNIHPHAEYIARRACLEAYARDIGLDMIWSGGYDPAAFLREVWSTSDGDISRCRSCYGMRMEAAAARSAAGGFDAFATTLCVSPYQNHTLLRESIAAAAERHGVTGIYEDMSPRFRQGRARARGAGMYMQKYCGCILSEGDRYRMEEARNSGLNP